MPASSLVVVDTDILIDVSREIDAAITALQHIEHSSSLAISVVTQMELIVGCRDNSELQILEKFLSRFQILALNEQTSSVAVNLMRDYRFVAVAPVDKEPTRLSLHTSVGFTFLSTLISILMSFTPFARTVQKLHPDKTCSRSEAQTFPMAHLW
jgi:hypothetical protein